MQRVLTVQGTGRVSQEPDTVVMRFSIVSTNKDYDQAMNDLNQRTAILKRDIVKLGFPKEEIKTTNFNVSTEYDYINGKQVFRGYTARHDLKLEFPINKEQLNQLIRTVSTSGADAEFSISFEIKDKEGFHQLVLQDAVNKAKRNAKTMAQTAEVRLGKILRINYSEQDLIQPMFRIEQMSLAASTEDIDIEPEDVVSTDTVTIEWEIEDYM
jgi:uncharacterized protein